MSVPRTSPARADGRHQATSNPNDSILRVLILRRRGLDHGALLAHVAKDKGMRVLKAAAPRRPTSSTNPELPDVVLLDAGDVDEEDIPTVAETCSTWSPAPVLAVYDDVGPVRPHLLLRAGARGIVERGRIADDLLKAIRQVVNGELWLDGMLHPYKIRALIGLANSPNPTAATATSPLTEREHAVADLAADGHSSKIIARRLAISDSTVRHHLTSIYAKLSVIDRLGLSVLRSDTRA